MPIFQPCTVNTVYYLFMSAPCTVFFCIYLIYILISIIGWGGLGSRVVSDSVLDLVAEGPGFKSQPRCYRATVLGKLFTPIVPLFTKQRNW